MSGIKVQSLNRMLVTAVLSAVTALGMTAPLLAQAPDEQDRQKQERQQKGDRGDRAEKQAAQKEQEAQREQQQRAQRQEQQVSAQRRQQLDIEQKQRLVTYRQREIAQERLSTQREAALQQQNRAAQYRYQQQYQERRREQMQNWNARSYEYNNDRYFYSAPRYRYVRAGKSYQTNQYGADFLRQAVNYGYEQGLPPGQADRADGWRSGYKSSYAYQDGDYGYNGYYVSPDEYRYYFRQGFRRGYDDGYNNRTQYGIDDDNGNMFILTAVLTSILNVLSN